MKLKVILDLISHLSHLILPHSSAFLPAFSVSHKCPVSSASPELWASLCPCPCFAVNASSYTWNVLPSQPHSSRTSWDNNLFMKPFLMHPCHPFFWAEVNMPLGSPSTLNIFLFYHLPDCAKSLKLVVYIDLPTP